MKERAMKGNNILKALGNILVSGSKGEKKEVLKEVLKVLRKRKIKLKKEAKAAKTGKEKKALTTKLKLNRKDRKKVVRALRKLSRKR
jgi:hypothetical protein